MDGTYICKINEYKPEICKKFPQTPKHIRHFKKCTYYFKKKKNGEYSRNYNSKKATDKGFIRYGHCCQCGACCIDMYFDDIHYPICPYRIKK